MKWRKFAFAVVVFLLVLELVLQLGALAAAMLVTPPKLPEGTGANVLCVGDSFTYGIGAGSPAHSYPGVLQRTLRAQGLAATVQNLGRPGKDSSVVLRNLPTDLTAGIEVLCVMVGTNDSWSHPDLVDPSVDRPSGAFEWRWRTGQLLALLTRFTFGSWQATGPAADQPTPLADPGAGFAMLERAGVIPRTPRACELPPLCPEPPAADVDRALRMVEAGRAKEALQLATSTAAAYPDCAHAWLAVSAAASARGNEAVVGSALDRLRKLARDGSDAYGSYALLTAFGAVGYAQEQYEFAKQRVAVEPRDIIAWKALQHGAFALGHHDEFLRVAPEALAIGGRLDANESAIVARHYARVVCKQDASLATRLIVASLLLDGSVADTRAVLRTVQGCVSRPLLDAALQEEGIAPAVRAASERLFDEARGGDEAAWANVLRQHLGRMVALARARGVKTVLIGYPFYREELERVQRDVASELGIAFVAVRERIDQELRTRPREDLFVADGHCNDAGYAIVAELVARAVAPLIKN